MNGSYRGIIAALIGWLALVGAAPQQSIEQPGKQTKAQAETRSRAPTVAPPPNESAKIINRPVLDRPCGQGQDNRQSDLCAQWKAADAASKAAWWAAVATLVTSIGTIGLFWQIKLTLRAVRDTGKATVAMERQNEIAVRQQRPWVTINLAEPFISRNDRGIILFCMVELGNIGTTPAFNTNVDYALGPASRNPIYDFQVVAENVCDLANADEASEKLIVLPQGRASTQIIIDLDRTDPRHPFEDGVAPTFMVWANYDLPDGTPAHTSAYFTVSPKNIPGCPGLIIWDAERLDDCEPLLEIETHGYIRVT